MSFQLSPSVVVTETDLTNNIAAVSTSAGAFAGSFSWGPVLDPITVTSEKVLTQRFGLPNDNNFESFWSAANFLAYSQNLLTVRVDAQNNRNAVSIPSGTVNSFIVNAPGTGYTSAPTVVVGAPNIAGGVQATGVATLTGGEVDSITVTNKGNGYTSATVTISAPTAPGGTQATAIPVFSGSVTSITVASGGTGYTTATAVFSAPESSDGVTATGTVTTDGSAITGITITNPGSGYLIPPTITIGGPGTGGDVDSNITFSRIELITIVDAGSGYLTPPTVTILGTGTNAAASASITSSGVAGITVTNPGSGYTSTPLVTFTGGDGSGAAATTTTVVGGVKINNLEDYQTYYASGQGSIGEFTAKYPGTLGNSITVSIADAASFGTWAYKDLFEGPPGTSDYAESVSGANDELHIVIVDAQGLWTGTPNSVLERFSFVSKASDARRGDGTNNYYVNVLNNSSRYVWWTDHPSTVNNWGTNAQNITFDSIGSPITRQLSGGVNDYSPTAGAVQNAYALFANDEIYDISLIITGKVSATTANFIISNVAEVRRDCVVFVSPVNVATGDVIIGQGSEAVDQVNDFRNLLPSTSYGFLDSGFKYQYDRYNDVNRWIPLNGDIAGLAARTDYQNDPWFPIAGLNRGQIKNVIKLSLQPGKTERDNLFKNGVNPVVSFPGQGTVLFGDKTLLSKPSAFGELGVRRLFIVLEKAIATAAKYQLFEFNDAFTRNQFKSLVDPYLRDVMGRRGITDFRVVCDSSNNDGEVIDRNEFVADIYIKPARSIRFITLNFIAARTSANFNEIGA